MQLQGNGGAIQIETRADRLVRVYCLGLVTRAGMVSALDTAWGSRPPSRNADYYKGVMVDLRNAAYVSIGPKDDSRVIPAVMHAIPTAVVVPRSLVGTFLSCAMVCATLGVVLGTFTDVELAQAWVISRAKDLRAQRAMLRTRLPGRQPRRRGAASRDLQSDPVPAPDPKQEGPASL